MLSSSLYTMLKPSKTSPNKLFDYDGVTVYLISKLYLTFLRSLNLWFWRNFSLFLSEECTSLYWEDPSNVWELKIEILIIERSQDDDYGIQLIVKMLGIFAVDFLICAKFDNVTLNFSKIQLKNWPNIFLILFMIMIYRLVICSRIPTFSWKSILSINILTR